MTTAKTSYRHGYQPLPAGVFVAPFPYAYLYGWDEAETVRFCLRQLELISRGQSAPDETAAVVLEPVLGEGGHVPAPGAFVRALRDLCDRHGILLALDEVQSGFGRTGKLFALEHYGVEPDLVTVAKSLGVGMLISADVGRSEMVDVPHPGGLGGTYSGNPLACAVVLEAVDIIHDEAFLARATELGEGLRAQLKGFQRDFPAVGNVRGLGPMLTFELVQGDGTPDPDAVQRVVGEAYSTVSSCCARGSTAIACACGRSSTGRSWNASKRWWPTACRRGRGSRPAGRAERARATLLLRAHRVEQGGAGNAHARRGDLRAGVAADAVQDG